LREPQLPTFSLPVAICRRMTDFYRRHLCVVEAGIELEELIGVESAALLRAGYSIELEAVSDHTKYRKGFIGELCQQVLGGGAWKKLPRVSR